jgi:RimJ/RimL family protein N-acetyltransferase
MLGNQLLQGELVYLNAITREDIPLFAVWFANPEMLSLVTLEAVFPKTEEDEYEWYERMRKRENSVTFAIRTRQENRLIGNTSLALLDWHSRSALFGIAVGDADYWGRGYGTDATRVIVRYGFLELNLHRIELGVFSFNPRAIRSYEKVGFTLEGTRRQALFREGQYYDIYIMAILREEWQALNP